MRKRMFKKRIQNNAGMSLIEILIAMAIVSVAIVPLLYCFVQIFSLNMRGRALQQTTVIAQTVMENCKAYKVEDIKTMIDNPAGTLGKFLKGDYAATCTFDSSEPTDPTDPYEFFIDNIVVDNRKYGIAFTLEPISKTTQTMMQYDNMNDKLDGVFIADETKEVSGITMQEYEADIFWELMQHVSSEILSSSGGTFGVPEAKIFENFFSDTTNSNYGKANVERSIVINATTSSGVDTATVTYKYTLPAGVYEHTREDGNVDSYSYSEKEEFQTITIYSNSNTNDASHKTRLENIYFFYYPTYSNTAYSEYSCEKDVIKIENNLTNVDDGASRNLNVYIIKQKSQNLNQIALENAETTYYDVKINKTGGNVVLYHNFNDNLSGSGSTQWEGSLGNDIDISVANLENKEGLVVSETEKLMYKINVTVYENPSYDSSAHVMTGDQVLTLDGTKIDW